MNFISLDQQKRKAKANKRKDEMNFFPESCSSFKNHVIASRRPSYLEMEELDSVAKSCIFSLLNQHKNDEEFKTKILFISSLCCIPSQDFSLTEKKNKIVVQCFQTSHMGSRSIRECYFEFSSIIPGNDPCINVEIKTKNLPLVANSNLSVMSKQWISASCHYIHVFPL